MLLVKETKDKYGYLIEEFSEFSSKPVIVQCDYCGDKIEKLISSFNIQRKKSDKDSCNKKECKGKKISETKQKLSGIQEGYRKCSKCNLLKELNSDNFTKSGSGKYRHKCRNCMKIEYHENKDLVTEKLINTKDAIVHYENSLTGNDILLPYSFFSRLENIGEFIDYIFKIKTNMYINRFKGFNMNFIKEFRLHGLFNKFNSIFEIIDEYYPDYIQPWELEKSPQGYWNDKENSDKALLWFVDQLKQDKIIDDIRDIPKVVNYKLTEKYHLGGLISNRFNASVYKAIESIYPGKFKIRDFNLPHGYYKDKNNRLEILDEFVKDMLNDKTINSIEDIPSSVDINTFDKYNLKGFLTHVYRGVSYGAFNELYPNKWKVWEFNSCPTGFWDDIENMKNATDWLIDKISEDGLIDGLDDLPNVLNQILFSKYNMARLYQKREIVFEYIAKKYPKDIAINDFNLCIAKDGTKCLSKEEVIIHNFFIKNKVNAKYCTKKTLFRNEIEQERYSPDWMINENIIVEYFGLYVDNYHNNSLLENYRGKTERKIKYYNSLNDYIFIDIYPTDLQNNFKGLINKLNKFNVELKIS